MNPLPSNINSRRFVTAAEKVYGPGPAVNEPATLVVELTRMPPVPPVTVPPELTVSVVVIVARAEPVMNVPPLLTCTELGKVTAAEPSLKVAPLSTLMAASTLTP